MDHINNVEKLSLVFVDSLDLNIVQSIKGDLDPSLFKDPLPKTLLVFPFDVRKLFESFSTFELILFKPDYTDDESEEHDNSEEES